MSVPKIHPKNIEIHEFQYELPEDKIAKFPIEQRDQSKLLVYENTEIIEDVYRNITRHIDEKTLILFNEAKVIHARLYFRKETGGRLEIFCLEPDSRYADISTAMKQEGEVYWKCLVKGIQRWKDDSPLLLDVEDPNFNAKAYKIKPEGNSLIIRFTWKKNVSFSEFLEEMGKIPIPPYLKRESDKSDDIRYQTIFAKNEGSVAAPTASLHFTESILEGFRKKNIDMEHLTLHVGAGTFMPVKSEKMEGHEMHSEWIEIPLDLLKRVKKQIERKEKTIAIGTTSTRTIESVYWIGVQILRGEWNEEKEQGIAVEQWYPYEKEDEFSSLESVNALINYLDEKKVTKLITRTQLIIAPGYDFKMIDGIITNFHQPSSTLLLIISALVGENWKTIYRYALDNNFRFLSYGDGSLLWK
ncbi:MAG: S-adenosylmethionine:tRNA ribosyltransferase-isomerase [Brumimicrobium sp.]